MASEVKTNKLSPVGSTVTLGDASDLFQLPASAEIDIASGATLDVNGTIDVTGATLTGFPGLFSSYAVIEDLKTQGTEGGAFSSGAWRTRDLNTEVTDPDGIVSISSNQFTLAAGNYLIKWYATAKDVNSHKSALYDITGTAYIDYGSSEDTQDTITVTNKSIGSTRVTPSGSNVYEIRHWCETTKASDGFGKATNFGVESYCLVEIYKES